jgi:hypothetical protein
MVKMLFVQLAVLILGLALYLVFLGIKKIAESVSAYFHSRRLRGADDFSKKA